MAKGVKGTAKKQHNSYKEVPCIIGIDQSYTRTGIAVCTKGKLRKLYSINFINTINGKQVYTKSKTMKRIEIKKYLDNILDACLRKYPPEEINIICERVRTFTGSEYFRPQVIKAHSGLITSIVDAAYVKGVRVYSVDTRGWKARVLGTTKPIFEPLEGVENPQKFGSVRKVIELGFEKELRVYKRNRSKEFTYNDDMADAACIALYGFSGYPYNLQLEE